MNGSQILCFVSVFQYKDPPSDPAFAVLASGGQNKSGGIGAAAADRQRAVPGVAVAIAMRRAQRHGAKGGGCVLVMT
jgi:hypothetical protein